MNNYIIWTECTITIRIIEINKLELNYCKTEINLNQGSL